ncbi:MmgE/PrpD family protein [Vineibacter terrae]|uniref:MmgE/PrpD family protein n=1 Tax=Vineibacter terrae TaxID=2586908 RepID=A0A5C8PPE4_9HYPH|nr:MmgE/PrpD family protein [Vineibacter terrae]TXL76419.1 MmgE/PrpD family protein [Vineibacter terrae]HEX2891975.1 MmgE/PrpD family protein [Vineibacter terrae]
MNDDRPTGLTRSLAGLLRRPIVAADRRRAALHVLDWLGCAAAGAKTPPGLAMIAYGRTLAAGSCRAVGGLSLASRDAAIVNGAVGNVLEMDDFYRTALVHPGPVVVPAALAVAQETGATGEALLDALVRGFEVMIRVGRSVGPTHYKHFHNTATCGVFGSAAAAGSLLGLDEAQMVDALGNAGTQASGLWQCRLEDTMSKQLHNGRAAQAGLIAAQLATHGFTGAEHILEGPLGFYSGMCPDAEPALLLAEPDAPWLLHGASFKPWPACRHAHPTIDAVLAAREAVDIGRVRRIIVETYRDAIGVCDRPTPRTAVEAKFSLQHASAVVLLRGRPDLADFDAPAAADPDIATLRAKVELHESEAYTRAYPAHFGASLRIELEDGEVVTRDIADALGDPENPLPEAALRAKAQMLLASAGYPRHTVDDMLDAAVALERGGGVDALMRCLA